MKSLAARTPPHLSTLVFLTAFSTMSLNMFLPSLGNIAADLEADYALVNLSIAGYLAVTAVLQLIMGPLSDRYGRRPVLLVSIALFTVASVGCLLSRSIEAFLFFRFLQGAIISGGALPRAIIRDTSPALKAASLIGYVSMAMAVAPMIGPMLGGALDELFGWRASFVVFAALGGALFALCWIDLGETAAGPSMTVGQQLSSYGELLRSRRFWGYALCMAFSTGAYFAFLSGAPLVAETVLNISPAILGVCLGSITCGFAFGAFLSGRYAARYPLTTMIIAGRLATCGGLSAGLLILLTGRVDVYVVFGSTIFVGIGNGLSMPGCGVGAMSVRTDLAGSASGLSGALTVGFGAALASVTGAVLTETRPAETLLVILLACSLAALWAALDVRRVERRA